MAAPKEKRYTVEEFRKLTDIGERAELIDGVIYDMSPSPSIRHQRISGNLFFEIKRYIKRNNGKCEVFEAPTDVKLNDTATVIPDIFVACNPDNFDEQQYNGAPDWIIEIVSPSNAAHDFKDKLYLYSKAGVREYWIIDPVEERVLVYRFGKPHITELYTFDDPITAGIYSNNSEPLTICVNQILC